MTTMRYMMLLFETESTANDPGTDEADIYQRHQEFAEWCASNGVTVLETNALCGSSSATTIRTTGDELVTLDGPAAELKEALGGYYLIDVASRDLAIEASKRVPSGNVVELRPVWEMEDTP